MTDNDRYTYEAMFLLDNQEVRTQGFNAVRDWVKTTLEKQGIAVNVLRLWSERPLAYTIGQRRRATYLLGWLEASGEAINAAKRELYLVGPVFRCMFLRQEAVPEEEAAFGIQEIRDEDLVIPEDEAGALDAEAPSGDESTGDDRDDEQDEKESVRKPSGVRARGAPPARAGDAEDSETKDDEAEDNEEDDEEDDEEAEPVGTAAEEEQA